MRLVTFTAMKLSAVATLVLCVLGAAAASAQGPTFPQFESYPVSGDFYGTPAPAIISHPGARLFRTMIKEQAKAQPNFAGHYRLATWGCGSDCQGLALIDARTGKVYFNPRALNVAGVPNQDEERLQFRADSRLMIISGSVDGFHRYQDKAKFYYEWRNNHFRLIRKTRIKKYNP
jgi:PAS domain-containing protein